LLDPEAYAEQETAIARAANPWGSRMDLPQPEGEAEPEVVSTTPEEPSQLSVASIEQRLATEPSWWPDALAAEVSRAAPRKSALRAILRVAEDEGADPDTLTSAHAVLDAL
jgi:hypothetical protein